MKLARRLSLVLALLAAMVLTGVVLLQSRGEGDRARNDAYRDHRLLGRVLGGSFTQAWAHQGEPQALALLEDSNRFQQQARTRWVWLETTAVDRLPRLPAAALKTLPTQGFLAFDLFEIPEPLLVSYTAVKVDDRWGAIEIAEPLTPRAERVRHAFQVGVAGATGLALLFLGVALWLARKMVGQPTQALVELSQKLGAGELTARAPVSAQQDELGVLATAMNQMAERLRSAQERLAAETAALRHADRLTTVGQLAAGVAHELGTPLNVVDGRAKMISGREVSGAEAEASARIISEQVRTMTRIIRQLLDFARRGATERRREPLKPLVSHTLDLLRPLAAKRDIVLDEQLPQDLHALVDAGGLQQVLTNLLVNAVQAMQVPGTVRVSSHFERRVPPPELSSGEQDWLRIDVLDGGPGIPEAVGLRIFEPFFTTKDVGQGTGLGLSVSYGIVRDQGGWLGVRNAPGGGACFSIYLPPAPRAE